MTFQALTGNPANIKAPKTPMSERASAENKRDDERNKRPKKSNPSRCILPIDLSQDIEFLLDYDWDKSFDDNLFDAYGRPPSRNPEFT